jgi:hypothetical protein
MFYEHVTAQGVSNTTPLTPAFRGLTIILMLLANSNRQTLVYSFLVAPAAFMTGQKTFRDELLIRFDRLSERASLDCEFANNIIIENIR